MRKLPGVVDVTMGKSDITIETRSKANSKFLDALLEDTMGSAALHFKEREAAPKPRKEPPASKPRKKPAPHKPKPSPGPRPNLTEAEKVVKKFGKALSGLPHVVGVEAGHGKAARTGKGEEGSSGADDVIILKVDDKRAVRWLDDMLEDTINGVLVQFEPAHSIAPGHS